MNRREFLCCAGAVALAACVPDRSRDGAAPSAAPSASAASARSAVTVTVFHDLICPWCRIGLHNLERVLAGWSGPTPRLDLRPNLLNPNTPPEGTDLRRELEAKYGAGSSSRMFERVTQAGARAGVSFAWERITVSPSTIPGHALIDAAPEDKKRPLLQALHEAYFSEGVNIGATDALIALAEPIGIPAAEVKRIVEDPRQLAKIRTQAQEAIALGVRGVPNFRIGGATLSGAQPVETLRRAIEAAGA